MLQDWFSAQILQVSAFKCLPKEIVEEIALQEESVWIENANVKMDGLCIIALKNNM